MMWPQVNEMGEFCKETYIMDESDAITLARQLASVQCLEIIDIYKKITCFATEFSLKASFNYQEITREKRLPPFAPKPEIEPPVEYEKGLFRFFLIEFCGIAFAGTNAESFIGLKKAVKSILPYCDVFFIDCNHDSIAPMAGYVPAPRYDEHYNGGKRCNLGGRILPYEGKDALDVYCNGFSKLLRNLATENKAMQKNGA